MSQYGIKGLKIVWRNMAQAVLYEHELKGQLSDGRWENSEPDYHWHRMCDADSLVSTTEDGSDLGPNFSPVRRYRFNEKETLEVIGERMLQMVRATVPGCADYTENDMLRDLKDMNKIMKMGKGSETARYRMHACEQRYR
jgi:hypothetical protein